MAKKDKQVKPIQEYTAAIFIAVAVVLMAALVFYIVKPSETVETNESYVGEQSFGEESSVAPPVFSGEVKENMSDAEIGDLVLFGKYEQNAKTADGSESIEWIVVDKQDDKLLLVSLYCLDTVPYNQSRSDVAWGECSLGNWLSGTFVNTAFNETEAKSIIPTENGASTDKVFVLSAEEVAKYFESDALRIGSSTKYADSKGADKSGKCCLWWLRDNGTLANSAAYVFYDGTVRANGYAVDYNSVTVRPAMWVSADAEKTEAESESENESNENSVEITE